MMTEWNGERHNITGCCMAGVGQDTDETNVYTFNRSRCERTSGPNVTQRMQQDRRSKNDKAKALNIGEWIHFDSKQEDEPIWLGRVMSNPEWGGMCILVNDTTRRRTYDNEVEIGINEVAICAQWYEKIDVNSRELIYRVSRTINEPQVQSNYYLVNSGFVMHEMNGRVNQVPRLRSVANNRNDWHRKECRFNWTMDNQVRQDALTKCGVID